MTDIKCSVDSCKHNKAGSSCTRKSLTVGSSVSSMEPKEAKHTECESFDCC